ncbi:MAG: aldehyde dehydrogenase family protein, partial [Rhodobiaceae bacterium]
MFSTASNDRPVVTGNYIDGVARPAQGGRTYALYNPARPDELVGHAALSSIDDVDAAVRAAHAAYPAWSRTSYAERAARLNEVADFLESGQDDVDYRSRLFCREHGKIIKETHIEVSRLGDRFRTTAAYADRLARDEIEHGPPFDTIITR